MRIGNIHLPAIQETDRSASDRRTDQGTRRTAAQPARDTADLLALSAGLGLRALAQSPRQDRQTLVNSLMIAREAGAYRPDYDRVAEKLLDWGFDVETGRT